MKAIALLKKAAQIVILYRTPPVDTGASVLQKNENVLKWTGKRIELVELIYALDSKKCINNGLVSIIDLCDSLASVFGIEIKDCYSSYVDIKRRKNMSRTYFLDELTRLLNDRMELEDS